MTHEELRELTGSYALGALTRDERRSVEAHLV
jgi:anti-sigma-K factor RskA